MPKKKTKPGAVDDSVIKRIKAKNKMLEDVSQPPQLPKKKKK